MNNEIFAQGLCFYKLFCTFVIGAVIGDMVETIFCYHKYKKWMSRSSFIYGHMSVVWGFAFSLATILAYYIKNIGVIAISIIGTIFGGIYEYMCSVFTETFMGVKFWDYSKMPYNIAGRINLKYCFYWGMATVIWIKIMFPILEIGIEKIPIVPGTMICNLVCFFLVIDAILSIMAIKRYIERSKGKYSKGKIWRFLDYFYPDRKIEKIYPHIKICEEVKRKKDVCEIVQLN